MASNAAELVANAGEIGAGRERFDRDPRARTRGGEAVDRGLCSRGIVELLMLPAPDLEP